jgi:hypothetical protein
VMPDQARDDVGAMAPALAPMRCRSISSAGRRCNILDFPGMLMFAKV